MKSNAIVLTAVAATLFGAPLITSPVAATTPNSATPTSSTLAPASGKSLTSTTSKAKHSHKRNPKNNKTIPTGA